MEWLTYLICKDSLNDSFDDLQEERKNITQVWKELTFGLETISVEEILKIVFKNTSTTDLLLQEEDVCRWISSNITRKDKTILDKRMLLKFQKLGTQVYLPDAAYQIYQQIDHLIRNEWIRDIKYLIAQFKSEHISDENKTKIGRNISFLQYNLKKIFNISILKPENVSENVLYKPGYLRWKLELLNKNPNIQKVSDFLHKHISRMKHFVPDLDIALEVLEKTGEICDLLRDVLKLQHDANHFQVLKFLVRNVLIADATVNNMEDYDNMDCLYELIRSLPPLLVQLMFFSHVYWYDAPKNVCKFRSHGPDLWSYLLPQWRCNAFCDKSIFSTQCPRFAEPGQTVCSWHRENPSSDFELVRYYKSNCWNVDALADHYENTKMELLRYAKTHRVINPMETLAPQRQRKYATRPKGFYLPIVRYQNLYHQNPSQEETKKQLPQKLQQQKQYCGTFFFYEPESSVYLFLDTQKTAFFATKLHAWMELYKLWSVSVLGDEKTRRLPSTKFPQRKKLEDVFDDHEILQLHLHEYEKNCKISTTEKFQKNLLRYRYFARFMKEGEDFDKNWHNLVIPLFFPTQYMYKNLQEGGVGDFDQYDQDICIMARDLGYTNLVLQHEIGGHDCVTEILHTGSNVNQFLFTMENVIMKPADFDKDYDAEGFSTFPKIWFPEDNGIVYVNSSELAKKIPCTKTVFAEAFANIDYNYDRPQIGPQEKPTKCSQPSIKFVHNPFSNQPKPFLYDSLRPFNDFHGLRPTPKYEFEEKNV